MENAKRVRIGDPAFHLNNGKVHVFICFKL